MGERVKDKLGSLCQMLGSRYKCRGVGYNFSLLESKYPLLTCTNLHMIEKPLLNIYGGPTYKFTRLSTRATHGSYRLL